MSPRHALLPLLALLAAACTDPATTGPASPVATAPARRAATAESGPPPARAFGPDSYQVGVFTGAGTARPGLRCAGAADQARECAGFLASGVDGALLDATLLLPPGAGPFPLVVLLHGWAGSKGGDGDIAATLLGDGYAVLRYSARGFGQSWGQANLADPHAEVADLRSLVGQLVDQRRFHLNADAVAVTGASYGGAQSWLAALQPRFASPRGRAVRIRTVVPIATWSDLAASLLPSGEPRDDAVRLGALKLSYVDGLFASGVRRSADRPYPNYPPYLDAWLGWMDTMEPNGVDPVYGQIVDGLAGGRSIWWQSSFWDAVRAGERLPILAVQGFTDDLFPPVEAIRMVEALRTVDPAYPVALYLGDVGHPRARNKPEEVAYALGLIRRWLAYYLAGEGGEPPHVVYAAVTRPRGQPFDPADVLVVPTPGALASGTITHAWTGEMVLVNPVSDPLAGFYWDPLIITGSEELKPNPLPPEPARVPGSLAEYTVPVEALNGGAGFMVAGLPRVALDLETEAPRVQLDARLYDVAADGGRTLITRGTFTVDRLAPVGRTRVEIPTYGNLWPLAPDHTLLLELTNLDSPYIAPSRVPSASVISHVTLELPVRP